MIPASDISEHISTAGGLVGWGGVGLGWLGWVGWVGLGWVGWLGVRVKVG